MSKKYEDITINYIMLALVSMNFFFRGSIILLLFGIFNILYVKDVRFNFEGVVLVFMALGMIISLLLFPRESLVNDIIKTLNYVFPYIVGYCGYLKSVDKEKYIKRTLFALYLGYLIYIVLTYIINTRLGVKDRNIINVWTGEVVAATLVGLLSAYVVAYAVSTLIYSPGILAKIAAIVGVLATILTNMQTATRTPFVLIAVVGIILLIMGFAANENKNYSHLLVFAFLAILLILLFELDLFGVKTAVTNSPLVKRFSEVGMETRRGEIAKKYFDQMFIYPWGGVKAYEVVGDNAHNLWQQFYDFYGIIPSMLLMVVTFSIIVKLIQLFMLKYKKPLEYTIISIYLIVLTQMLLEPIATGFPILFWTFLLIHGFTTCYYKDRKKELTHNQGKDFYENSFH